MSVADIQATLTGEPDGAYVRLDTEGRVIRPALALPAALVDELRLHCEPDRLEIAVVDRSNIAQVQQTIHARAFDQYDLDNDAFTIGLPLSDFRTHLRNARKGKRTSDPVTLHLDSTHSRIGIERAYDTTTVERTDEVLNIDPNSIRSDAESPELTFDYEATIDVPALRDVVDHFNGTHDHLAVGTHDGRLVMAGAERDDGEITRASAADFGAVVEVIGDDPDPEATSLLSLDYLVDIADALHTGLINTVTLRWSEEFPVAFAFERTTDEGDPLYEGEFMQAPRIASSDSP